MPALSWDCGNRLIVLGRLGFVACLEGTIEVSFWRGGSLLDWLAAKKTPFVLLASLLGPTVAGDKVSDILTMSWHVRGYLLVALVRSLIAVPESLTTDYYRLTSIFQLR